jgi:hypothetical protein
VAIAIATDTALNLALGASARTRSAIGTTAAERGCVRSAAIPHAARATTRRRVTPDVTIRTLTKMKADHSAASATSGPTPDAMNPNFGCRATTDAATVAHHRRRSTSNASSHVKRIVAR